MNFLRITTCWGGAYPRFLIGGADRAMVAIDGVEGAQFNPAREKVRGGAACEAANVVTGQRVTGKSKIEQHGHGHAEVSPGG